MPYFMYVWLLNERFKFTVYLVNLFLNTYPCRLVFPYHVISNIGT